MEDFGIAHTHGSAAERVWRRESMPSLTIIPRTDRLSPQEYVLDRGTASLPGRANHTKNSPGPGQDPVPGRNRSSGCDVRTYAPLPVRP